jgi:hypothetical protein
MIGPDEILHQHADPHRVAIQDHNNTSTLIGIGILDCYIFFNKLFGATVPYTLR